MNLDARDRLAEVVKKARGSMSQRAYGKLIGVSATAVQDWEKGESIPETENLTRIAESAGYTLEELLTHLEGRPLPQPTEIDQILKQIRFMPLKQVALIGHAVADRLAAVAESSGQLKKT